MQSKTPMLVWIDLETTGLDPTSDVILQAAAVLTTTDLKVLAPAFYTTIHYEGATLAKMDAYVRKMHEDTGLLEQVLKSQTSPTNAFNDLYDYVRMHSTWEHQLILAGSSVHFDRAFLNAWVPHLSRLFYHRHLDVSVLKQLAEWWGHPRFLKHGTEHLALDDIYNSINELKHYRATMLREVE